MAEYIYIPIFEYSTNSVFAILVNDFASHIII